MEGSGESPAPPEAPSEPCEGEVWARRAALGVGLSASLEMCLSVWQPSACPAHAREHSPVTYLVGLDQRPHKPATLAAVALRTCWEWAMVGESQPAGLHLPSCWLP